MTKPLAPPNYTQIPNALLDDHMSRLSPAQFKVAMAIARQTFGWHKKEDQLSLSTLASLTGLSEPGVIKALRTLMTDGLVARRRKGQSYLYRLLVNSVDQQVDASGKLSLGALVNSVDQQVVNSVEGQKKQEKKKKESVHTEGVCDHPLPSPADENRTPARRKSNQQTGPLDPRFLVDGLAKPGTGRNAYEVYREHFALIPSAPVISRMNQTATDLAKWRTILSDWQLRGYRSNNYAAMLDVYANGWRNGTGNQPADPYNGNGWKFDTHGDVKRLGDQSHDQTTVADDIPF